MVAERLLDTVRKIALDNGFCEDTVFGINRVLKDWQRLEMSQQLPYVVGHGYIKLNPDFARIRDLLWGLRPKPRIKKHQNRECLKIKRKQYFCKPELLA